MPKEYYHDIDLNANQLYNSRLHNITTAARIILGGTLTASHKGFQVYDTDLLVPYYWDGIAWQTAVNGAIWGNITGLIANQTDLITYLSGNYYPLSSNPAGYLTSLTAAGLYVPLNRNITINGITFDLSADRTWTISSLPPQAGNSGNYLTTDGTNASWAPIPLPTPAALTKTDDTNVTLTLTGSPNTSLLQAVGLQLGWTGTLADSRIASAATWNAKQDAISLTTLGTSGPATFIANTLNIPQYQGQLTITTTGTSGAATLIGNTLNIPQYTDQFVGTVTSVAALTLGTTGTDLSSSVANGTTTPVITLNVPDASATNRGALTSADWNTFNSKPNAYYQTAAPGSPVANSYWMSDDTGVVYQYVNDGDSAQWVQQTLPIGPQGAQGVSGTNNIDLLTSTTLTGLLKGNGATVVVTSVITELGYTPEDVANKSIDPTFASNSDTLYPSQKAVKTALDNFADDVDYAIMINQKLLFNL